MNARPAAASSLALALVLVLAGAAPARASGVDLGDAGAGRDSSRFLPRWMHASLEAGVSWMQSPAAVKDRYNAGVALGAGLTATAAPRLRLAARLEYLDLPNGEAGYYGSYQTVDGQAYAYPSGRYSAFGGGHSFEALALASVRPWRQLWLEGGAGWGHFSSGYPRIQFLDGTTGEWIDVPGESGWGAAWTAGAAYEFRVGRKPDHLYASVRWVRMDRDGTALDYVPLTIGYRFD